MLDLQRLRWLKKLSVICGLCEEVWGYYIQNTAYASAITVILCEENCRPYYFRLPTKLEAVLLAWWTPQNKLMLSASSWMMHLPHKATYTLLRASYRVPLSPALSCLQSCLTPAWFGTWKAQTNPKHKQGPGETIFSLWRATQVTNKATWLCSSSCSWTGLQALFPCSFHMYTVARICHPSGM